MTDAELLEAVHVVVLAWMKGEFAERQAMERIGELFEDNGRPFIGSVDYPANDTES